MNNIETMKLALEALNTPRPFDNYPPLWRAYEKTINEAITALRQAIKQAQQAEPVVWMYQDKSTHEMRFQKHMSEFVDHSKTSEVPLYGEPLANHELQCVCGAVWCGDEMVHLPNKTPPRQPEQPKVRTGDCLLVGICASEGHKIQPPRQPLTDEEIAHATAPVLMGGNPSLTGIARAIESAHGIKEKNT